VSLLPGGAVRPVPSRVTSSLLCASKWPQNMTGFELRHSSLSHSSSPCDTFLLVKSRHRFKAHLPGSKL
jgi:hypothetical protein